MERPLILLTILWARHLGNAGLHCSLLGLCTGSWSGVPWGRLLGRVFQTGRSRWLRPMASGGRPQDKLCTCWAPLWLGLLTAWWPGACPRKGCRDGSPKTRRSHSPSLETHGNPSAAFYYQASHQSQPRFGGKEIRPHFSVSGVAGNPQLPLKLPRLLLPYPQAQGADGHQGGGRRGLVSGFAVVPPYLWRVPSKSPRLARRPSSCYCCITS